MLPYFALSTLSSWKCSRKWKNPGVRISPHSHPTAPFPSLLPLKCNTTTHPRSPKDRLHPLQKILDHCFWHWFSSQKHCKAITSFSACCWFKCYSICYINQTRTYDICSQYEKLHKFHLHKWIECCLHLTCKLNIIKEIETLQHGFNHSSMKFFLNFITYYKSLGKTATNSSLV